MSNTNKQIDALFEKREVKHHEVQLLKIIQQDFPKFIGKMLDIGCAAGSFIEHMSTFYPDANYTGFDISSELIHLAKEKNIRANSHFLIDDAINFDPQTKYDVIIASGVLSIFDDFTEPLNKWLSWLNKKGVLYVFGRFNTKDVDTIVHFRNNYKGLSDWEGGLTSYSIKTVKKFCTSIGFEATFEKFHLPIKIVEDENPIRTFTKETINGETLVINGANIIAEHYFVSIRNR